MSITCFIVDDEQGAIDLLKGYIEQTSALELIGASRNPVSALDVLTGTGAPEITFIDIDMRQLTGLQLAGMVNLYTTVVFTTAFPQHAVEAFEKEAFDYMLKPITYERFIKCIQHIKRKKRQTAKFAYPIREDFFNIKSEKKGIMVKIKFAEVIYIEGADNYIKIHTLDAEHLTYLTIRDMESFLPRPLFTRVHRSYLINVNFVKMVEGNRVVLENGDKPTLGNYYKERFLNLMDEHLVTTNR